MKKRTTIGGIGAILLLVSMILIPTSVAYRPDLQGTGHYIFEQPCAGRIGIQLDCTQPGWGDTYASFLDSLGPYRFEGGMKVYDSDGRLIGMFMLFSKPHGCSTHTGMDDLLWLIGEYGHGDHLKYLEYW